MTCSLRIWAASLAVAVFAVFHGHAHGATVLGQLSKYSQTLMAKLRSMPGIVDSDTNLIVGKPELGVKVDRAKTADLGVSVNDIASTLKSDKAIGGFESKMSADRPWL